ncbi:heparinase II/III family protein [Daejeonella sp. H1SJ63]|uniref:heparinase II/III domain-containing protein n=1 Tax=Daejeonella sp. H1SJ63 TaxID=3034145 RepID=UPI0023EC4566|nr:heparinase II/III family protein [Daejeonella sp. H1SJ63]
MKFRSLFCKVLISGISMFYCSNVYAQADQQRVESLKRNVESLIKMSLEEVKSQVPIASGIHFIGCPNCNGGAQEMNVLGWTPELGESVKCNFCGMTFPNEKFPDNKEKVIIAPGGAKQVYRYYENQEGTQYFYQAHAWFERWKWIQQQGQQLAQVWAATRDNAYGDRAAAIAGRFAQVFPDYAIRYDYPSAAKKFFPADQKWPYQGLVPYRGAKWNWWAYGDIPSQMANVYDILKDGYEWARMDKLIGKDTDKRIVTDLLVMGYDFTAANPEIYTNMSPGMYRDMVRLGRILNRPDMVHDGVGRFTEFLKLGFYSDGWWKEGTASYHDQTIGGLRSVAEAAYGYTDPADLKAERFDNLDLTKSMPFFKGALAVTQNAILPNGRKIPLNDTWAIRGTKQKPLDVSVSKLWAAYGNAAFGAGSADNQFMLNMNWSGNYGHHHLDNASIILYASGQELLSDIGYTHSKYRGWTLHTASHNTVVINQKVQDTGTKENPASGKLKFYDDLNPNVKVMDIDASPAYKSANQYRRRLIHIHAAEGKDYVIDRFDVRGGTTHDWFLHGMCEEEGVFESSIPVNTSVTTLVPSWGGTAKPKNQYEADNEGKRIHAYSYLRDIKTAEADKSWTATWRYQNSGLRTHNISQAGTKIYTFKAPSVRLADENDNKLDDYMRLGYMQRHEGGQSSFIAVHEPFKTNPWIKSVKAAEDTYIITYELEGKTVQDRVKINGDRVQVVSGAGWKYDSGGEVKGGVKDLVNINEKWTLKTDRTVPDVSFVRLDFPNGDTVYCRVSGVKGNMIELEEDPGLRMENEEKMRFITFPHTEYSGKLNFTVFQSTK